MRLRVFIEPQQGAEYEDQLALAQAAERLGFDAVFRSDHILGFGGVDGLPGPTETWTTLGAIARETSRIRLGALVTSATFRHPAMLAIQVAQVDRMSGGRVDFGLGTGWFEAEHTAYGIPFPAARFGLFQEQLEVITGLWATPPGETFGFAGRHYALDAAPALPKPAQLRIPVIIGGSGREKTPALAARFADEYNAFTTLDRATAAYARVREACRAIGRDPGGIRLSIAQTTVVGRDAAEVARRSAAINREVADLEDGGLAGTPQQVIDKLARFAAAGADTAYLQLLDIHDLDHLELIAAEVLPAVSAL